MMRKIILLIVGLFILTSCTGEPAPTPTSYPKDVTVIYRVIGNGKTGITYENEKGDRINITKNLQPATPWEKQIRWNYTGKFPSLNAVYYQENGKSLGRGDLTCSITINDLNDQMTVSPGTGSASANCVLNPWRK